MKIKTKYPYLAVMILFSSILLQATPARADFWGGDIPLLMEIVVNTLNEISQLKAILGSGSDTLNYLHDINSGIQSAMNIMRTANSTMNAGLWGNIRDPNQLFGMIQDTYGLIPHTQREPVETMTDQTIAEAFTLHNQAFDYADLVDPEAERIKVYSQNVSPLGAARQTSASLGVLIHVNDQILRTNAASLKVMSEQLAYQNRQDKLSSQQFVLQYQALENGFDSLHTMQEAADLTSTSQF
jgi:hypothetical protein